MRLSLILHLFAQTRKSSTVTWLDFPVFSCQIGKKKKSRLALTKSFRKNTYVASRKNTNVRSGKGKIDINIRPRVTTEVIRLHRIYNFILSLIDRPCYSCQTQCYTGVWWSIYLQFFYCVYVYFQTNSCTNMLSWVSLLNKCVLMGALSHCHSFQFSSPRVISKFSLQRRHVILQA